MKKHPKQAFGIFHDGLVVRLVHLVREAEDIYLQGVDHTDLDKYWYKILDDPSVEIVDSKTKESKSSVSGDIDIDEFDNDYVTNYQLQPSERMLGSFDLAHGVIAINVYDDNIIKDAPGLVSKKEIEQFVRSKVSGKVYKAGDYQSSLVDIGGEQQHWLHRGTNRLLDLVKDYARTNRIKVFYQLADANDIALTDFFKCSYIDELDKPTLLVYLGQEYRKAFLFRDGEWQQTLKLQITQNFPEPEVVSSKLTLAIDSAGIEEPERIVICGDLANTDLVENLSEAFPTAEVKLFEFKKIIVSATDEEILDYHSLSKFCIPIALAYKALHPEDECFHKSNFLPSRIIEGQKEFKIAWHGFLILIFIFASVLMGTNLYLKSNQALASERHRKQVLSNSLAQKRGEAQQIMKIEEELSAQEQNLQVVGSVLENKNFWTELLDALNRRYASRALNWLSNLRIEKNTLHLSGISSNRRYVVDLANALPQGSIDKVTAAKIRDHNVWSFEIKGQPPAVNWLELIEADMKAKLEQDKIRKNNSSGSAKVRIVSTGTVKESSNIEPLPLRRMHLPPLIPSCLPGSGLSPADSVLIAEYNSFVNALQQGHIWNYRKIGNNFIANHPHSSIVPGVRWWMAYRMYLDRDYMIAGEYLRPVFKTKNHPLYAHAVLLRARLDLALGHNSYNELYNELKLMNKSFLTEQITLDVSAIRKGESDD